MKFTSITCALLLALGSQAHAQTDKTRDQLRSEFADAIQTGDMVAPGDSGLTLRERDPRRYPARTEVAGKTREQVKAELREAIRTGDVLANGDSGLKLNEAHPQWYANVRRPNADAVQQAATQRDSATR
jgi:hypothetical protein